MKRSILVFFISFLLIILSYSEDKDELNLQIVDDTLSVKYSDWQPFDKEKDILLDSLLKITKELVFPSAELSQPVLLWEHPEVAVLWCNITSIHEDCLFPTKRDTFRTVSTIIFIRQAGKWKFRKTFGIINKRE